MEEFATRSRGPSAAEEKRQGKADDLEDIMVGAAPASRPGTEAKGADKDKSVLGKVGKITVDDPKVQGSALMSYVTYCVTVEPPLPGVSHVRRRFRDFEWLRSILSQTFPGMFVPPLPPKDLFKGRDVTFAKERMVSLSRFMNRIAKVELFQRTEAFQMFLTRHESSFDAGRKDVEKARQAARPDEWVDEYRRVFPQALLQKLPDDPEEGVLRLRSMLESSHATLSTMIKRCETLEESLRQAQEETAALHGLMVKLEKDENDYAQRPQPPRPSLQEALLAWATAAKQPPAFVKNSLHTTLQWELEDVEACLEILKTRENYVAAAQRAKARADKWRDPSVFVQDKMLKQREEDLQKEEDTKRELETFTKIILCEQFQRVWADKVALFQSSMVEFAQEQTAHARSLAEAWQGWQHGGDLERAQRQ